MKFSPSTLGFYGDSFPADRMPHDALDIDDATYQQLLSDNRSGRVIAADENGLPISIDFVASSVPDVEGFKADIVVALGGIVAANNLLKLYPMFVTSLADRSWANLSALVVDALNTHAISAQQYADFQAAFDANDIPILLPTL